MTNISPSNLDLETALAQLQSAAASAFELARPIPPGLNHSQAFLDHERQSVFMQEWICIGREDEIAEAGDFITHKITDVPVLVVRQQDGEIRAFVNACAHRQAHLVAAQKGSTKKFTCPYHAWTYDCAGELIRAPYMEMKPEFDPAQHGLRPLRIAKLFRNTISR